MSLVSRISDLIGVIKPALDLKAPIDNPTFTTRASIEGSNPSMSIEDTDGDNQLALSKAGSTGIIRSVNRITGNAERLLIDGGSGQAPLSAGIIGADGNEKALVHEGNFSSIASAVGVGGSNEFTQFLGSRYLLDPNEYCGWSSDGLIDQTMTNDLGNVGASISRTAGGLCYPFDVRIKRLYVWHYNSNALVEPWGWRIAALQKTAGSNSVSYTDILRQCTGTGATAVAPNDYGNNQNQLTDIDLTSTSTIPAGQIINFGVEAPTANTTNYYVQVMAGYMLMERV